MNKEEQIPQEQPKKSAPQRALFFPQAVISAIADEVAKVVIARLPHPGSTSSRGRSAFGRKKKTSPKKQKEIIGALFLDTSAIIDGRIFDVIDTGILAGIIVIPESILLELKHIADSQDTVKRERGRRGLVALEKTKKAKHVKVEVLAENGLGEKHKEVDERLIAMAKKYKGRIVTGDYNLEKKATISGVKAVNVHELANRLKVQAVPGESLHIKIQHIGKDPTQGVGYLDDGTMIVVEQGSGELDKFVDAVVSRVIQTSSGRILFAKKI